MSSCLATPSSLNAKLIIPASLWHRAFSWYHHYLQHPGHSRLEETMRSVMYWNGVHTTIRRYVKTYRSFQVNKRHSQMYGHISPKLVIMTPWRPVCVDLIGPCTLKGEDGSSIDFMCLTMINPAISWFKIVELPTVDLVTVVPRREVRRLRGQSHPRLMRSARQPAFLPSEAKGNRS
jgi:hypothetical protein